MSKEHLQQFAGEIGGEFESEDSWLTDPTYRIVSKVRQWSITFKCKMSSATPYGHAQSWWTDVRLPYLPQDDFRFEIGGKNFLAKLLTRFFGPQRIDSGYGDLDHLFITGNDEAKVRRLLANQKIRSAISGQAFGVVYWVSFGISSPAPGSRELYGQTWLAPVLLTLRSLHTLFVETLNELEQMGSIADEARPPNPLDAL